MLNRRNFLSVAATAALSMPLSTARAFAQQLTEDEVFRDPVAPVLGNHNGDVTIVEFFDYQCPYCKRSHSDVMSVVREDGNVRLVLKDWPIFGNASVLASQAVLGANEIGAYEMAMEALMSTPASLSEDDVKRLLTSAGLDLVKIEEAVRQNSKKISDLLKRNHDQALAFNFAGTPSFVIGRATYSGQLDKEQLREAIRRARIG